MSILESLISDAGRPVTAKASDGTKSIQGILFEHLRSNLIYFA